MKTSVKIIQSNFFRTLEDNPILATTPGALTRDTWLHGATEEVKTRPGSGQLASFGQPSEQSPISLDMKGSPAVFLRRKGMDWKRGAL